MQFLTYSRENRLYSKPFFLFRYLIICDARSEQNKFSTFIQSQSNIHGKPEICEVAEEARQGLNA